MYTHIMCWIQWEVNGPHWTHSVWSLAVYRVVAVSYWTFLDNDRADERSDIFTFGILLYELLAGVHPFTRSSASGTMSAIVRESPSPVSQFAKDAPVSASVTIERLLAKDPRERYQSFREVRSDLGQLLQDASGMTPAPHMAPAVATSTVERTRFVGREAELNEARRLLDRAVAGQGSLLLLGGEPGVGKTRLAEEVLAEGSQRGCLALTGTRPHATRWSKPRRWRRTSIARC